jgi:lipopolysaccharide/colanic/teichoic acid biosynthesis glycosyltransferase
MTWEVIVTVHIRQPLPAAKIGFLLDQQALMNLERTAYTAWVKRTLDVCLVLLALIPACLLLLPFLLLIARDGHAPFYRQERVGLYGRRFYMWKLRSMVPDAETQLEAHLAACPKARAEWNRDQKLRDDPRVTTVGRIIRKTSIDELPQLWNVLIGDMSLVGPRPMMPNQQDLYPGRVYYAMRPGITGFWQTSVRNESSFSERAEFDTAYFSNLSFGTDLRVVLKTVLVVLRGTGY